MSSARFTSYAVFLVLFATAVFAAHAPFLSLPFYWDELGQFVPAALDLYRNGAWVPHSAVPNAHPPGVPAYLAAVWRAIGFSIAATRVAMLALASGVLLFAFLLAIRLCRGLPGAPALGAVALLFLSPLFFAQAMMAQLDMPAMLLASAALLFFLDDRVPAAALACTVLVMLKETGLIVPAVFALWLAHERRWRDAAWFALPAVPLAAWFGVLGRSTGHWLGDPGFTYYNLRYPLHPVRLGGAVLRRLWYLFGADFHWVGAVAVVLALRRTAFFRSREWRVAACFAAAQIAVLCVIGGAMLERYLLPVLPVLYAAFAAAMTQYPPFWRRVSWLVMAGGLAAGLVWNPPYPFPPEDNLAFTDIVPLHEAAASFLARQYPGRRVATAWPLTSELSHPEFGYVARPVAVEPLPDFRPKTVKAVDWNRTGLFVLFSRTWDPERGPFRLKPVRYLWTRYWGYEPDITPLEVQAGLPLTPVAQWSRRGQWVEIYETKGGP